MSLLCPDWHYLHRHQLAINPARRLKLATLLAAPIEYSVSGLPVMAAALRTPARSLLGNLEEALVHGCEHSTHVKARIGARSSFRYLKTKEFLIEPVVRLLPVEVPHHGVQALEPTSCALLPHRKK